MSDFIVSARKYRPFAFTDVVGQNAITSTLSNAIRDNHLAQSFLFCGPRGVGKTTCARILAKTINCENITENINACNECDSCKSFNESHSFNIHELDAASNNSVDDIRNLVEQVRFAPQVGKYNIYIIDEVHMLSSSAFNAFLKTLEEPPTHAIFILATTEKHKIIPTILSRCQIFDFRSISIQNIIDHLKYVSKSEKIISEDDALHIIAQKSGGSLRDSLSMFDRLVNASDLTLTYKSVIENLNILDHDYYLKMTDAIIKHDVSEVLLILNEILNNGFDGHQFVNGLATHIRDLLVCKNPETVVLLEKGEELQKKYLSQSANCDLKFLIKSLKMTNECDVQYRVSKNQRLLVELCLLMMASIGQFSAEKKKNKNSIIAPNKAPIEKIAEKQNKEEVKKEEIITEVKENETLKTEVKVEVQEKPPTVFKQRIKSSTISISGILDDEKEDDEKQRSPIIEEDFSETEMMKVWNDFANIKKEDGRTNLFITLTALPPNLKDKNKIEIKISNDAQQKLLNENRVELMEYLRKKLKNDTIEVVTFITEEIKTDIPYTSTDKFNKMIEKNTSLKVLRDELGLDPDY
ncbi:MAG: DNA polymerase III subunit gamma/tau [Flavobacteriales bacterium]|nr:DNA polymerase III subunit gamma/tau [Flavobacteriales bacterium]